jgi:hypothetical protein
MGNATDSVKMTDESSCLGFLKYEGKLVKEGYLDARISARALTGFDSALRYLVARKTPELAGIDFEIPVRIERGSWVALLPHTIGQWVATGLGVVALRYATTAAATLAKNDFKDASITAAFQHSIKAIQWLIRIGKHLGSFKERSVTGVKWAKNNSEFGLPNEKGEYLYVPREYFEIYVECPTKLLSDVTSVIEKERELIIGYNDVGKIEEVTITRREKHIFNFDEPDESEILFPEFVHGMRIELEGVVTRENEMTNSVGFKYEEHILQCHPRKGTVKRYKPQLFLPCKIFGTITRESSEGTYDEVRPKIIFDDLEILKTQGKEDELFES